MTMEKLIEKPVDKLWRMYKTIFKIWLMASVTIIGIAFFVMGCVIVAAIISGA
jgi:hypothetical protein